MVINKNRYERQMRVVKRLNESWENNNLKQMRKEHSLRVREMCFACPTFEDRMKLREEFQYMRESAVSKIKNSSKRERKEQKYERRVLREKLIYNRLGKLSEFPKRSIFDEFQEENDRKFAEDMLDVSGRVQFNSKLSYKACSGMRYLELEADYRATNEDVLALEWACDVNTEYVWVYSSAKLRQILVPLAWISWSNDSMNLESLFNSCLGQDLCSLGTPFSPPCKRETCPINSIHLIPSGLDRLASPATKRPRFPSGRRATVGIGGASAPRSKRIRSNTTTRQVQPERRVSKYKACLPDLEEQLACLERRGEPPAPSVPGPKGGGTSEEDHKQVNTPNDISTQIESQAQIFSSFREKIPVIKLRISKRHVFATSDRGSVALQPLASLRSRQTSCSFADTGSLLAEGKRGRLSAANDQLVCLDRIEYITSRIYNIKSFENSIYDGGTESL